MTVVCVPVMLREGGASSIGEAVVIEFRTARVLGRPVEPGDDGGVFGKALRVERSLAQPTRSCSAQAEHPETVVTNIRTAYWVARSSRAMTVVYMRQGCVLNARSPKPAAVMLREAGHPVFQRRW